MPGALAMKKFKAGTLHSGSKKGPKVTNRKQAIAIMLSEKRKEGKKVAPNPKARRVGKIEGLAQDMKTRGF